MRTDNHLLEKVEGFPLEHYEDRRIFRSLLSPDFFDSLFKEVKSGDKRMLPMKLSFRKLLGERSASSGYFCPLRYGVNKTFKHSDKRLSIGAVKRKGV